MPTGFMATSESSRTIPRVKLPGTILALLRWTPLPTHSSFPGKLGKERGQEDIFKRPRFFSQLVYKRDDDVFLAYIRKGTIRCIWEECKEEFTHVIPRQFGSFPGMDIAPWSVADLSLPSSKCLPSFDPYKSLEQPSSSVDIWILLSVKICCQILLPHNQESTFPIPFMIFYHFLSTTSFTFQPQNPCCPSLYLCTFEDVQGCMPYPGNVTLWIYPGIQGKNTLPVSFLIILNASFASLTAAGHGTDIFLKLCPQWL